MTFFEKTSSGFCPHWALFCASVSSAAVYPVAKQDNSLQGRVLTYSDESVLFWHEGGPRAVVEKCLVTFARGINGVLTHPVIRGSSLSLTPNSLNHSNSPICLQ